MDVTRLRISGFKSFSDPVELMIEPGLTGIVGPNGCGKSNVVDALRWVMGESSAKGLRGTGMDDVIFNGSAFRPAFDFAEVTLRLNGPVEGLPGFEQAEDIEIVRRIGRGSGSSYRMNGREARARDVQLLFADAAAGARSAAIVGQGQIGLIVEAKPDERRRLLEDAAGIGGLHARRREAVLRLETTAANLARVTDLLDMQRAQLSGLEKQAKDALRYRNLAGRMRALELLSAKQRLALLVERIAAMQQQARQIRLALAQNAQAGEERRSGRAASQRSLTTARDGLTVQTVQVARLAERVESQRAACERDTALRADMQRQIDEAAAVLAAEQRREPELTALLAEREKDRAALAAQLREAEDARATLRATLPSLEEALRDASTSYDARLQQVATDEAALEMAGTAIARLNAAHDGYARHLAGLPDAPDQQALLALRVDIDRLKGAFETAESKLDAFRREAEAAEAAMPGLRAAQSEAERLAHEAGTAWHDQQAELREAQARRESEQARHEGLQRLLRRLDERRAALERAAATARERRAQFDLKAATDALETARTAFAEAERHLQELQSQERHLGEAEPVLRREAEETASHLARLQAEEAGLRALVADLPGQPLIDRLVLDEAYGAALAAALGDDLLADAAGEAPTHWRPLPAGDETVALPAGVEPLARYVTGSPLLDRRLRQVGLVEAERAVALLPCLRPGQRLVSRAGDLWRWDGFVRLASSGEAAARLAQRRRLAALRREIEPAAVACDAARSALRRHEAAQNATRVALKQAEANLVRAEREANRLLHAKERTEQAIEAADAERARVERELTGIEAERLEPARELAALEALVADVPDLQALAAAAGRRQADLQRLQVAAKEAARRVALRETERRQALAGIENLAGVRDDARRQYDAALLREATLEAEFAAALAGLEGERTRLAGDLERVAAELAAATATGEAAARKRTDAMQARDAARRMLDAARHRHDAARAELDALALAMVRDEERAAALLQDIARLQAEQAGAGKRLKTAEDSLARLRAQLQALGPALTAAAMAAVEGEHAQALAAQTAAAARVEVLEKDLAEQDAALGDAEAQGARLRERLAGIEADLAREIALREAAEAHLTNAQAAAQPGDDDLLQDDDARQDEAQMQERLGRLRSARDRLGAVNLRAAVELEELQATIARTEQEIAEISGAVERLRRGIATLNSEARARLLQAFGTVEKHFQRLFTQLFGGGRAQLRLTNLDDPLNAGLELEAMPPGKKLTHVSLLSGGEKSLTGLALVFAFFLATPAPLCILDEVDAPLDDANVDRFVALTEEIAKETGTRFLCVTHHPLTMARMHRLYGVTMVERGVSRLVSVALDEAVELRQSAA